MIHRVAIFAILFSFFAPNAFAISTNKILIISSYGADYQWSNSIIDGINIDLEKVYPGLELNVEYLSSELFPDPSSWQLKMSTILNNYKERAPLAIVLISDEAWMAYRGVNTDSLQNVPILLCAVKPHSITIDEYKHNIDTLELSHFTPTEDEMLRYNATGVLRQMNVSGYLDLMKKLVPEMNNLALISDNRFYGIYTRLVFEQDVRKHYADYPVEYLDARFVNTDSLLDRLPDITPSTGLLLTSWLTGEHGFEYSKDYIYKEMASVLKTPIFLTNDIGLEKRYFLGGYFNQADFWGQQIGKMLLDVIKGKSPKDIKPTTVKDEQCYVNWRTLQKFELLAQNMPRGVVYRDMPESILAKYRIHILVILFVLVVLMASLVYVLRSHLRLKKAQKTILRSVQQTNMVNEQMRETRKNLIIALNKAEESDRLKSAFVANMSHEIRTPLNAIVGFSNLITTAESDQEREEASDIIARNSDLLLQLISDILDISKMEAGMLNFTHDDVNVDTICGDAVTSLQSKCRPGVVLSFVRPTESLTINTDPNRLLQVLINLINNATKFTYAGSIEVGYFNFSTDLVEFYVKDSGIGIPEDQTSKIFDRFIKLNDYIEGTGLGLAICRTIVEILGGEIGVDSQVGQGSRFWFRIKKRM